MNEPITERSAHPDSEGCCDMDCPDPLCGYPLGTELFTPCQPEPDRTAVWDDWGHCWEWRGPNRWRRSTRRSEAGLLASVRRTLAWDRLMAQYGPLADQPRRP